MNTTLETKSETIKAKKEREREEAKEILREYFPAGSRVYTILKSVSASGMSRHISVVAPYINNKGQPAVRDLTYYVAKALDWRRAKDDALLVGGCGMDMGYHVAYTLSRSLYRDVFACIGENCPSNDHTNGDAKGREIGHAHTDGGYALTHSWL